MNFFFFHPIALTNSFSSSDANNCCILFEVILIDLRPGISFHCFLILVGNGIFQVIPVSSIHCLHFYFIYPYVVFVNYSQCQGLEVKC